jgi:cytochrome c1
MIVMATASLVGCGSAARSENDRGRILITTYGCGTCHEVAGVATATGLVGPPLTGVARRMYLAGRLANTPENMVRWIRHPHEVDPQTVMPELQVSQQDAKDLTEFLYTQK